VVEFLGQDPRSQQMLHRFVGGELRHQIQPAVAEAQSVEHERHRRRPHADELPVARFLLVQPVRHPDLPADLRDDAQMIEMLDDKAASHAPSNSLPQQRSPPRALWISPYPESSSRVNPNCGMRTGTHLRELLFGLSGKYGMRGKGRARSRVGESAGESSRKFL